MANHPSALKRQRQDAKRQQKNRWWKSRVRSAARLVTDSVAKKKKKEAAEALVVATREIYKAEGKGALHGNAAARKVARLSRLVASL